MKLLIAYDGSRCSEAALDDLVRAGLPKDGEAMVVSVAEAWLPLSSKNVKAIGIKPDAESENLIQKHSQRGAKIVSEAETFANHAKKRLQRILPGWTVNSKAAYGSPAWEILTEADDFKADLVVVGSHGRSAISRLILGSISQKVLTESNGSVRIARGRIEVDPTPVRIVIGFDGSKGAQAAVEEVAARRWRLCSEIRLVSVADSVTPSAIGRFVPPSEHRVEEINESERRWIEKLAENALAALRGAGFDASFHIHAGNPKQVLIEEAERWNADCIFVGANAYGSRLERFLTGSTSAAVAARAHCSVEVVRQNA